jgi:hypothetical protein
MPRHWFCYFFRRLYSIPCRIGGMNFVQC